eukprot:1161865-Pelagomonas_calceolata.AAC.16
MESADLTTKSERAMDVPCMVKYTYPFGWQTEVRGRPEAPGFVKCLKYGGKASPSWRGHELHVLVQDVLWVIPAVARACLENHVNLHVTL